MSPKLPPLREVIASAGLDARKSLGQHFLLDLNLTARIAREAGELAGRHVVEIGPGPGGLTRALLETAAVDVTALEIDPRAVAALAPLAEAYPGRLRIVEADALGADIAALVPAPRAIVANLPYNVGTPLLVRWLGAAGDIESMTLMFQQEVAERIVAAPGTDAYGRLAVLAGFVADARLVMRIPPAAFTPPPKVWSAVVRIVPRAEQPSRHLFRAMERVTGAAFGQRRKMLRSSLKPLGGAEALLGASGIDGTRRAETLTGAEFVRLAAALASRPEKTRHEGGEPGPA
ncbi:16S rRNA (adenine(1518)-N(6)/adenine(1519)-N(6))-dimethyltransferase RsmA [Elioraea rosea]|uniref:16S rRNA (adenine(1518)-N(6)/adenine(1519)-N(6))- dimethyltransferase RsmA n=1 Tax=Elioraea rosea TaxID=2492390 RepID=UPI0011843F4A|nr:16S rRNA (adenine(1518)-N(6)/adenine(1519)-N(6))-dimethyltransferase RsmA [Elioraea rosea]